MDRLGAEAGAFAMFRLEAGFNPQTARIVARYALSDLPETSFVFDDATLVVIAPFDNPYQVQPAAPAVNPDLYSDVERALVGQVQSIKRGGRDDLITIRTKATPEAILPLLRDVPGLEIRAVETSRDETEILAGPITVLQTREVKTR